MSVTPVFWRLKRMAFPRRDRVFSHGEPVNWKNLVAVVNDYHLTTEQVVERTGLSEAWVNRLMRGEGREWMSAPVARVIRNLHDDLLTQFRRKPAAGERGGRPKLLPPSDERKMIERYKCLLRDLKTLRTWIRAQTRAPSTGRIWDWLCECFRSGQLRALQFSPHFFDWVRKNYNGDYFRSGGWVPRDLALELVAFEFDVPKSFVPDFLSHHASDLHQDGAIPTDTSEA
jgi:transcriptional regulator with XRE-family HTH domain